MELRSPWVAGSHLINFSYLSRDFAHYTMRHKS